MTTEKFYPICCVQCGAEVASLSPDEWEDMSPWVEASALCFDCDSQSAATTPSLFWEWESGDVFVLGDVKLRVEDDLRNLTALSTFSHTHVRDARANSLSRSTYLNTSPKQDGEWVEVVGNNAKCFCGGHGRIERDSEGEHCLDCGQFKPVIQEIILPSWVITSSSARGEIRQSTADCRDCLSVRGRHGYGYCDYHHALLIEQMEDGGLGWGNDQ